MPCDAGILKAAVEEPSRVASYLVRAVDLKTLHGLLQRWGKSSSPEALSQGTGHPIGDDEADDELLFFVSTVGNNSTEEQRQTHSV